MLDSPDKNSVSSAMKRLQDVGALDSEYQLTPLGHHLAFLPCDVKIGKLLLFGALFRCLDSALTIGAFISHNKSPFLNGLDIQEKVNEKKREFSVATSDQLTNLKIYNVSIKYYRKLKILIFI